MSVGTISDGIITVMHCISLFKSNFHNHIQRENLNCELSSVEGSGECEVKRESNSKLKIVVNEEAATVKAKAILQGQSLFL